MSRIFQYHPAVIGADAIGASMNVLNKALRSHGVESYVVCADENVVISRYATLSSSVLKRIEWRDSDLLILHYSFFNDELDSILDLPVRKLLVYHNITPGRFFRNRGAMSWLGDACDNARTQLRNSIRAFELGIGDSSYNCAELKEFGLSKSVVIPVFFNEQAFSSPDLELDLFLNIQSTKELNIIFVGRFVPNKRHDLLIDLVGHYKRLFGRSVTLHLAGKIWSNDYYLDLLCHAADLDVLNSLRVYQNAELSTIKTLYAAADAFVSMSEHEGFMVPVLESFAVGCPVVAYRGTAVGETMGFAGIKLDSLDPTIAAAHIELLRRDRDLRNTIVREQSNRLTDFQFEVTFEKWISLLSEFIDVPAGLWS
jgi:glycosyltransferase involved in cell wall biosynthesis